jgi:hypothetical protein
VVTQKVESSIGPRGDSFRKGGKEAFPGVVYEGFIEEGMPRYLDGRELQVKPGMPEMWS